MTKRDVELNLGTIAGGKLAGAFEKALGQVASSFDDPDLDDAVRVIAIKIKFTKIRSDAEYLNTEHTVQTTLPAKTEGGVAWIEGRGIYTDSTVLGDVPQMDIEREIEARARELAAQARAADGDDRGAVVNFRGPKGGAT